MNNPFELLSTRVVYQDPYVTLHVDAVNRPNGVSGSFAHLDIKLGAIVLALSDANEVWLVREYKYAIARPSLELIGGGIDDGESPLDAARRELKEEAGLTADEWIEMGTVDAATTMVNSPNHLFLARGLHETSSHPEGAEILELVRLPIDDVVERIMRGEITHGPSCCLVFKTAEFLRRQR